MSLKIYRFPLGSFATNCYLLVEEKFREAIVIDLGDSGDYLVQVCREKKLSPKMILATHGHFDHLLGVFEFQLSYQIPFFLHQKDEFLLKKMSSAGRFFLKREKEFPPLIYRFIDEREIIHLGEESLEILATPGHTPGSISFYNKNTRSLFSGDLIFERGQLGRTDFSYSDEEFLHKSLEKIFQLSSSTKVYPGHGEPFILREFKNLVSF